jgi:hypothetical protein
LELPADGIFSTDDSRMIRVVGLGEWWMRWERESGLWVDESMNVEREIVLVMIEFEVRAKLEIKSPEIFNFFVVNHDSFHHIERLPSHTFASF